MKKKKDAAPQKTKEFAVNPFKMLKGLKSDLEIAREEQRKAAARKAEPPTPVRDQDDTEMFFSAVSDVRPLVPRPARESSRPGTAAPRPAVSEEERKTFLKAVDKLELDVKFEDGLPDDVEPLRPANSSRLRQLRKGAIRIDLELDLHGLTREEALSSLEQFVLSAFNRGQKAVLVITGKGNNSPDEPVLLGAVSSWLRDKGRSMVAEFSPAPRQLGGGGAFVVFLKDRENNGK